MSIVKVRAIIWFRYVVYKVLLGDQTPRGGANHNSDKQTKSQKPNEEDDESEETPNDSGIILKEKEWFKGKKEK